MNKSSGFLADRSIDKINIVDSDMVTPATNETNGVLTGVFVLKTK